jgi:hypothetical protein
MDLPPPVQDPEPRTPEFRLTGAEDSVARRLETVEARLVALGARLEQMEASLHQVIRDEGHTVSTEIRYTLSELGRRLALDLPQTLDRHRQMIVAELRPASPDGVAVDATAPADARTSPQPEAATGDTNTEVSGKAGDSVTEIDGDIHDTAEDEGDESSESSNAGGRRKRRRRRGDG